MSFCMLSIVRGKSCKHSSVCDYEVVVVSSGLLLKAVESTTAHCAAAAAAVVAMQAMIV